MTVQRQHVELHRQHVELHRKLGLRRRLLADLGEVAGCAYVPFCGEADIAVELYQDRHILAADIDEGRARTAAARLPGARVVVADCDQWPADFADVTAPFALADFDAYAYPYDAFRAFWEHAQKAPRLAVFFTDGMVRAFKGENGGRLPGGDWVRREPGDGNSIRRLGTTYLKATCRPWLEGAVTPWRVVAFEGYRRRDIFYWGAVLDKGEDASGGTETHKKTRPARPATDKQQRYVAARLAGMNQTEACKAAGYSKSQSPGAVEAACIRLGILPDPAEATEDLRAVVREIVDIRADAHRAVIERIDARKIEIVDALIEAAISGNVPAVKEALDRLLPAEVARLTMDGVGEDGTGRPVGWVPITGIVIETARPAAPAGTDKHEAPEEEGE